VQSTVGVASKVRPAKELSSDLSKNNPKPSVQEG